MAKDAAFEGLVHPGAAYAGVSTSGGHWETLPAGPVLQLVRLVKRWDVRPEELLAPLGLNEHLLEEPLLRVPVRTMRTLVRRAVEITREPALGFYLGLEKRVTSYGYLGFAALSAATLGEALELTVRFAPAFTTAFSLRVQVEGGEASLTFDAGSDRWRGEEVAELGIVVGLWQIGSALTGRELSGRSELTIREPSYYRRFEQLLPAASFGQPVTKLIFSASLLDLPIVTADRGALRLAREQCEAALEAAVSDSRFVQRVRELLARPNGALPTADGIATALGVSSRTLKRKLAAHNVSFSQLLAEAGSQSATLLLSTSSLSIDEIGLRLGYSTAPNFIRAFRRWTGTTPLAYRRASSSKLS